MHIQQIANSTYGAIKVDSALGGFVWKNLLAGKHNGWNEIAAYRVAQRLGFSQVPAIAVFQVGTQPGTVAQFIRNAYAPHDIQYDARGRKQVRPFLQSQDFTHQAADMILFDTIIGNKDRHAGNWLIDPAARKLWWIDHGSARWAGSEKILIDRFKKIGYTLKTLAVSEKSLRQVMADIRTHLERCAEERLEKWAMVRREDWEALFQGLPEEAGNFQRQQACDSSWDAVQKIVAEKGIRVSDPDFQGVLRKISRWQPSQGTGLID